MSILREHIKHLLTWLLYSPTPEAISAIMDFIEYSDAGVQWRSIRNAINRVVGNSSWDTAMLIACRLDARVSVQLRDTLKALKLQQILSNSDERNLAAKVFKGSQLLQSILVSGRTQDIVTARKEFLVDLINKMTTIILFPRRGDFYSIARRGAGISVQSWLPHKGKGEDDYWGEAYVIVRESFSSTWPSNYSGLMVQVMRNEMISSINHYNRAELSGIK